MKRLFALVLFFLLIASPAWATIASVGTLTSTPGTSTSSGTTVAATLTAACEAGNLCVCPVAGDNIGTSDALSTHITITDSVGGNTWVRWIEAENNVSGAGTGVVGGLFYTRATNTIGIGQTITATFDASITSKAITCWEFTVGAAVEIPASGTTFTPTDNGNNVSIALSGLSSLERLYMRLEAVEANQVDRCWGVVTTNYTSITNGFAVVGGDEAASIALCAEFRIVTATGETSNPSDGLVARDRLAAFGALQEAVAASTKRRSQTIVVSP